MIGSVCLGGLVWLVDHYGVLSKFYDRLGVSHDMSPGMGLCRMRRMIRAVLSLDVIAVVN